MKTVCFPHRFSASRCTFGRPAQDANQHGDAADGVADSAMGGGSGIARTEPGLPPRSLHHQDRRGRDLYGLFQRHTRILKQRSGTPR